jgi:aryl-alcohol dehydrogenase-like predicted oxidoreductase
LQSEEHATNAIIDRLVNKNLSMIRADSCLIDSVEEVAKKTGATMSQVSLAWLWTKEPVAAPIVGTTSVDHLYDLISTLS